MEGVFKNNSYFSSVYKHYNLPIYVEDEFSFFRCVQFEESFYGKTISELFNGNLRKSEGRYSVLSAGQKVSYWADSFNTARAEIKKHGAGKNVISFWAYDDASSTFPTLGNDEKLIIIDARNSAVQRIVNQLNKGEVPTAEEMKMWNDILEEKPDCMAYNSEARKGGVNFLFFEKGFKKLALRETKLYLGERKARNSKRIASAISSDYTPIIGSYGDYFCEMAKVRHDKSYEMTEEYKKRSTNYQIGLENIKNAYDARSVVE